MPDTGFPASSWTSIVGGSGTSSPAVASWPLPLTRISCGGRTARHGEGFAGRLRETIGRGGQDVARSHRIDVDPGERRDAGDRLRGGRPGERGLVEVKVDFWTGVQDSVAVRIFHRDRNRRVEHNARDHGTEHRREAELRRLAWLSRGGHPGRLEPLDCDRSSGWTRDSAEGPGGARFALRVRDTGGGIERSAPHRGGEGDRHTADAAALRIGDAGDDRSRQRLTHDPRLAVPRFDRDRGGKPRLVTGSETGSLTRGQEQGGEGPKPGRVDPSGWTRAQGVSCEGGIEGDRSQDRTTCRAEDSNNQKPQTYNRLLRHRHRITADQASFCCGIGCLTRSIVYLATLTALAGNLPVPDSKPVAAPK